MADVKLCSIEDVETELTKPVPNELAAYAEKRIEVTSDDLRIRFRNEGKDLDRILDGHDDVPPDDLFKRVVSSMVARSVADDLSKKIAFAGDDDLSSFSQFSEGAGGYTFSGTFAGVQKDIWFSDDSLEKLDLHKPKAGRKDI